MRVNKLLAVFAAATVVAAGTGVAVAYWTKNGSGSGNANSGTNASVVVNQTSTVSGLAPGSPAQPLSGNFDNPNPGPVYVGSVTATVTGTNQAGCTASDYTIAGTADVNGQVPAGNGVGSWSGLTIQFNNKSSVNQDACKGATVTIAYSST